MAGRYFSDCGERKRNKIMLNTVRLHLFTIMNASAHNALYWIIKISGLCRFTVLDSSWSNVFTQVSLNLKKTVGQWYILNIRKVTFYTAATSSISKTWTLRADVALKLDCNLESLFRDLKNNWTNRYLFNVQFSYNFLMWQY